MNILFFTDVEITPYLGGVERVTINLAKALNARGHHCFLGFFTASEGTTCQEFEKSFQLDKTDLGEQLKSILVEYEISTCVINLCDKRNIFSFNQTLYAVSQQIGSIKVVYGYYSYPGFELFGLPPIAAWFRLIHRQGNSNTLHGIIAHIAGKLRCNGFIRKQVAKKLKLGLYSDEIVLLSERYIPRYINFVGETSFHQFSAIGNPLSYPKNIDTGKLEQKEKIVLQIARFEDNFKRQTTALKIWKKIEEDGNYDDWRFIMIGYGPDELYIRHTFKKLKLKNAEILPAQNPLPFLEKASIYMLTSAYEGLPMIVLDAQQQAVTPIGFDSFEAIHDIIVNNENGIIIPEKQMDLYTEKLMWMMDHPEERKEMAIAGLSSCQHYTPQLIVDKWERVLKGEFNVS